MTAAHPDLRHYETVIVTAADGTVYLPIPFDPASVWGPVRHLGGSLNARHFRGVLQTIDGRPGLPLSPLWRRDCGIHAGDRVVVVLTAEGPIRQDMDDDVTAALSTEPAAAAFWDALAPFYRKAYQRWIDGTKRRPALRAARIAELVLLMKAGVKERPK